MQPSTKSIMSSPFPRIPSELARMLPWDALLQLFEVKSINQLEARLQVSRGTLSKAQRHYPTQHNSISSRGLSARLHRILLTGISKAFTTSDQMQTWMKKNWPKELLEQSESGLGAIYEKIDVTQKIFRVGVFPVNYVERYEKAEILDLLLKNRQIQVIWLTGQGCTGKSTLALSLLHHDLESLKRKFEIYFWVDMEKCDYETGLLQIAEQINMEGASVGVIEQKVKALTRKRRALFILDGLPGKKELDPWVHLMGYLGKLVVTSQFRLSSADLSGDKRIHQIQVNGFSQKQGRQFFQSESSDIDRIVALTGGSPLALRILSGVIQDTQIPTATVVSYLAQNTLTTLSPLGDARNPKASVRACLELSCTALLPDYPNAAAYFKAAGIFRSRVILKEILDRAVSELSTASHKDSIIPFSLLIEQHSQLLYRYNLLDFASISNKRFIKFTPLLHALAREYIGQEENTQQWYELKRKYRKIFLELLNDTKDAPKTAQSRHLFLIKMHLHDIINVLETPGSTHSMPDYQAIRKEWAFLISKFFDPVLTEMMKSGQMEVEIHTRWHTVFTLLLTNLCGIQAYQGDRKKAKKCFWQVLKTGNNFLHTTIEKWSQINVLEENGFLSYTIWHELFWRQIGFAVLHLAQCHVDESKWGVAGNLLDLHSSTFINCNNLMRAGWYLRKARILNIRGETREAVARLSQSIELSMRYLKECQIESARSIEYHASEKLGETAFLPNIENSQPNFPDKSPDESETQEIKDQLEFIEFLLENGRLILAERLMRSLHRKLMQWDEMVFLEKVKGILPSKQVAPSFQK